MIYATANGRSKPGGKGVMKIRFSEWVVILLIILFFALPVCSFVINDPVSVWPKCPTTFLYNIILK